MSSDKVKVFALAKQYGYKSSEFVNVLRDIGFPVTSYQASVSEWDVPIIEERLLKGGLIQASQATTIEEPEPAEAEKEESSGWTVVLDLPSPEEAEEVEKPEEEPVAVEEPAPAATAAHGEAVAEDETTAAAEAEAAASEVEEEPAEAQAEAPESGVGKPTVVEEPAESPATEPAPAAAAESPQPVRPEPAEAPEREEVAEPRPAAARKPEPEPAEAEPAAKERELVESTSVSEPAPVPTPKPRSGAKKVGKIDLAALGLVKAKQARARGNTTFTDLRDRESARRREHRTKHRERMKERRSGKLPRPSVSTVERKSDVVLEPPVTVKNFSTATGVGTSQIMSALMRMGTMVNVNAVLDEDTVTILAEEFGIGVRLKEQKDAEEQLMSELESARRGIDDSQLSARPPVIAFLGHVDHGKTSLIDAIRQSKVASGEAGGITQHIGAYQVGLDKNRVLSILDTPGHEAFTTMRARGAQTTDIAVLVVAADDGVMPQTEEAAAHAKEAGVPVIVAINKVDAPNANTDKVKGELAGIGLQPEDWGGSTGVVETSALRKTGVDELLERVMLEAELLELKAHPKGDAMGVVLEAMVSEGRGKVADVLVQDGTLKSGDVVLAGQAYGKIRRMYDASGKVVKSAGPSTPIEILGLNELPPAGERFYVVRNLNDAKDVAEKRLTHLRESDRAEKAKLAQENIFTRMERESAERVRVVLKADVQGSLEVLKNTLEALSTSEVIVELVHSGVGSITETDVTLAETAEGMVIGFNVSPDGKASRTAEKNGVEIRRYSVIYELTEDIQTMMEGLLAPEFVEEERGRAEVLKLFKSSRYGSIAGCAVTEGVIKRSANVRVKRDGRVLHTGPLESLRHHKDDVREVKAGSECGLTVEGFTDVQEGDVLEVYEMVRKARSLEEAASPGEGDA